MGSQSAWALQQPRKVNPPNIVIFLADDQGWGDLSCNGNTMLKTPNIDSLAKNGVRLDRFYVCPVCSPTRAEFLTGRYHPRTGVRGVSTGLERLNLDEKTLADSFKSAGYATAAFGKWHNGSQWPYHPNARGFDEYYGFTSGHWGEYIDPPLEHNGVPVRGKGFTVDDFTNHAIDFIEKNSAKPFLVYLPYNTPHSPFIVPKPFWNNFKDKAIPQRGVEGDREDIDVTRSVLAMCENIDANVGKVLSKIEKLGVKENTIVLYFSDNGPNSFRFNGGMKGRKGSTDEGGVRSPCFISWPGKLPAGKTVTQICGAIDLLPTLLSLSGVSRVGDKPLDGKDLSKLFLEADPQWPDRMIFSHWGGKTSVRTQQHRLDDKGALFDMINDPGQTKNITADKPELGRKLSDAVQQWRKEVIPKKSDERPIPVGFTAMPWTPLPARDGTASGKIKRSANAPNCSYFVNWTSKEDRINWEIEVNKQGTYVVEILYACPLKDAGSTIEISFNESKLIAKVLQGWDPPLITDQDVIPRPAAESVMKDFKALEAGKVKLSKGKGDLVLRALEIPGKEVMQVRAINLHLIAE
ncbi:MAG: N-acetylgalactosamine 6-sulfate sulfatase [Planctomycetes bacterium]|nr:N-acetylgalactosamine 6-sulfate sulfatase [Planctomycetota bacterium]